jgi:EEF1A lysine methyltransferase 2
MSTKQEHWNKIFNTKSDQELGWYEQDAHQTLSFLEIENLPNLETIFIPGAGTSTLIDALLRYAKNLILNDISNSAIEKSKKRIGNQKNNLIWLHHDISQELPKGLPNSDLWIDRAVLHFLQNESEIDMYFMNLKRNLKPGGHVLLAEFSRTGAKKCAGLELHRYSLDEFNQRLGREFNLIKHEEYTFINPFGDSRPYIYALYQKIAG